MTDSADYKRIYTGSEVNVQHLQGLLNEAEISSRVRNDFESGLRAGFGGGVPGQVQLFAISSQYKEAMEIAQATFPEDY